MLFIKLYGVLFGVIALILVAIFAKMSDVPFLVIKRFGFAITITRKMATRLAFFAAAFLMLPYYLHIDLSEFFPSHFEMEVFYDQDGLADSLSTFSPEELSNLGYVPGNEQSATRYYSTLDKKLNGLLGYEGFFSISDGVVYSHGDTTFKVTKTKGIHNYYISEARGELSHTLERPQHPAIHFKSFFEKLPSSGDYIRPNVLDFIFNNHIVIRPRFKQIVAEQNRSLGVLFDHSLVGATKVYLFPYPKFSNTVYFFDTVEDGLVPIGYAVYH